MNIEDLTIKEAKELACMFGAGNSCKKHPLVGKRVMVILPGRFIYLGTLDQKDDYFVLNDAQNVRYWTKRANALGGLAQTGPIDGDLIDDCPAVWFKISEEIAFMELGYE